MSKKTKAPKASEFVLDGSTTLAWYFKDEADAYAESVQDALATTPAVVPSIWPLEVANVLLMGERRKRSTEAQATKWLGYVRSLPITVDDQTTARAWTEILHLARAHDLSAYDAAYLELAVRRGLPMATLDDKLKAVAVSVGVPEFKP